MKPALIIALILLIIISITFITIPSFIEHGTFPVYLNIENKVGFALGIPGIHLGSTYPGGLAKRDIIFTNKAWYPSTVKIYFTANNTLSNWITINENNFTIQPSEKKYITITADTPNNATQANYTTTLEYTMTPAFDSILKI